MSDRIGTALVTGASRGLGAAIATGLASRGHDLALSARGVDALERLAGRLRADHGVRVTILPADLSLPDAAAGLVAALDAEGIAPAIVVNNAGFGLNEPFVRHAPDRLAASIGAGTNAAMLATSRMRPPSPAAMRAA